MTAAGECHGRDAGHLCILAAGGANGIGALLPQHARSGRLLQGRLPRRLVLPAGALPITMRLSVIKPSSDLEGRSVNTTSFPGDLIQAGALIVRLADLLKKDVDAESWPPSKQFRRLSVHVSQYPLTEALRATAAVQCGAHRLLQLVLHLPAAGAQGPRGAAQAPGNS